MTELPEAPASVTYSVTSEAGFNALVTYRATTFEELMKNMEKIEKLFATRNYKPQVKPVFQKKEQVYADHPCPSCGAKVVIIETSKGKMEKCETHRYDFKTKTSSGCAYVMWLV